VTAEAYELGDPKSETAIFIQNALDEVRAAARLDVEPVLPPSLPPPPLPRAAAAEPLPLTPIAAIAEITSKPLESGVRPIVRNKSQMDTVHVRRRTFARWPLFVCAFVAAGFGSAALLASPIGHKPGVQRVTRGVEAETMKVVVKASAIVGAR
jgi:hypothetical protein